MWRATFDADNRLVARGLEAEWENCLRELDKAKAELAHREALRPRTLTSDERGRLLALGTDLLKVWQAPTTLPRDKKELLRTVLEEVIISVDKQRRRTHLTLRWRGGALSEIDIDLPPRRSAPIRTDEDMLWRGRWSFEIGNIPAAAQTADKIGGEAMTIGGSALLAIENARNDRVGVMVCETTYQRDQASW